MKLEDAIEILKEYRKSAGISIEYRADASDALVNPGSHTLEKYGVYQIAFGRKKPTSNTTSTSQNSTPSKPRKSPYDKITDQNILNGYEGTVLINRNNGKYAFAFSDVMNTGDNSTRFYLDGVELTMDEALHNSEIKANKITPKSFTTYRTIYVDNILNIRKKADMSNTNESLNESATYLDELGRPFPLDNCDIVGNIFTQNESIEESIEDEFYSMEKYPQFDFGNNGCLYIGVANGKMFAGGATNAGIIHEYEIDIDAIEFGKMYDDGIYYKTTLGEEMF